MADGVLGAIAAAKFEEVARRFDGVSLDGLRAHAEPTTRSLAKSVPSRVCVPARCEGDDPDRSQAPKVRHQPAVDHSPRLRQ